MGAKQLPVSRRGKPNPIDIHVGSRVRLRRILLGLSMRKLSEAAGLTYQQIQKYEIGATRVGASRLYALSCVLDVPVAFFFEDMPPEISGKGGKPVPGLAEQEILELVHTYYRIKNPNVRKRLSALAKSVAVLGE